MNQGRRLSEPGLCFGSEAVVGGCAAGDALVNAYAISRWNSGRSGRAIKSTVASVIGSLNRRGPALPGLR